MDINDTHETRKQQIIDSILNLLSVLLFIATLAMAVMKTFDLELVRKIPWWSWNPIEFCVLSMIVWFMYLMVCVGIPLWIIECF